MPTYRKLAFLAIFILIYMISFPDAAAAVDEYNITDILEDGHIETNPWDRSNDTDRVTGGYNNLHILRGYVEWNITSLPNRPIYRILFYYNGTVYVEDCNLTTIGVRPSTSADNTLFWAIGNGTVVASEAGFPTVGAQQVITINADGIADLQAALTAGQTWYALGLRSLDEVGPGDTRSHFGSNESACDPIPTLYVEFYGDYSYFFTGTYYENGTRADPVTVTPAGGEGFLVNGTIHRGYTSEPTLFYWDIGGGYSRRIYPVDSENYTVTLPDDSFATYDFAIRDYTLSVDTEGGYLEAWRTINGTDYLIERNEIKDAIDDVSLNLVTNRVYRIRIRLQDGTIYDFGYFTPGVDTERTLVIDDLEYDDYAHVFTRHITVEAFRLNATHLQANYQDTRGDTTSIYVEISIRGGAQVYNTTIAAATAQVNWYDATDYVSYVVLVNATHPSYRNGVVYSRTFSGEETHPDLPEFDVLGLTTRLFCTGIVLLVGVTVSGDRPEVGLFAATSVAAAFVYYGVDMLSWSDITILYVIAVGIGLGGRVR